MTLKRRFLKRGAMIAGNHNRSLAANQHSPEAADLSPDNQLYEHVSSGSEGEDETAMIEKHNQHAPGTTSPPPPQAVYLQHKPASPNKFPITSTGSGRKTPPSPAKAMAANSGAGAGCVAKLLNDDKLWGPMGCPVPSHTDIAATFHDMQHSFMKRISITNITIRFALQYRSGFGQSIRIVGSIPMLGNWSAARAPQMTWTEGDIWVLDLPVPIAFHRDHGRTDSVAHSEPDPMLLQFEYKYVLTNSTPNAQDEPSVQAIQVYRWEEGANHQFAISESAVVEKMNTRPCTIWDTWRS